MDILSREDHIRSLITNHQRYLQKLKEQEALFGSLVPPYILIQIEDEETRIKELQLDLENLIEHGPRVHGQEVTQSVWKKGSPFPGLRAFTLEDAPIYFGRRYEIEELVKRLSNPDCRFVAVLGASGSGKSSVVWAGLWPRLRDNVIEGSKDWIVARFTPGEVSDNPFLALVVGLKSSLERISDVNIRELAEELSVNPDRLDKLCRLVLTDEPEWAEVVLFIDQFEELFTIVNPDYQESFVEMLTHAARSKRMRIVVTLRKDFYQRCDKWPQLVELMNAGAFLLSARILYEMITRPAHAAGLKFETGLPERILIDTGSNPGALPLMAYTLDELYHSCKQDRKLTHTAYEMLGRVQGAIGTRAENIFETLDEAAKIALSGVFRKLVQVDEPGLITRRRSNLKEVAKTKAAQQLIKVLTDARLLIQDLGEDHQPTVEVAHEALFRYWPRLSDWIQNTLDDLRLLRKLEIAAEEWEQNERDKAFLWPDERLKLVYEMIERLELDITKDLNEVELAFIERESDRLLKELENADTSHYRRYEIGQRVNALGDPRPGVGLRPDGLPDIVWCKVGQGAAIDVKIEGQTIKPSYFEEKVETETQVHVVSPFYIAKYPVTNLQYQAFINDDGYKNDEWWQGLTKPLLGQAEENPRDEANVPRVSVSWYEAIAFCRWLSAQLGYEIRLPTEAEWQVAATLGDSRQIFPWGKEWDERYANTIGSGLNRMTAVGMYPHGISPCGALDMSGTVREWTLTEDKEVYNNALKPSENQRIVRGGSWGNHQGEAQTNFRENFDTDFTSNYIGFRLCCVQPRYQLDC